MSYGLKLNTRTKLVAAALALVIAGVSHAGTQVGGGATLPAIGYVGSAAASQLQVYGTSVASTSLFGSYSTQTGNSVSYCQTGSGAGKNILAGIANYNVQNACPTDSTGTLHGFGAAVAGRSDLTGPSFAAADSPLNATDYSNYQSIHGSTAYPTQFPAVAGAVAIAFNLTDNTGAQVTSSEANFTDAQICSILAGTVTTWDQVASAFTLPAGHSIPANPINVQYRSDGSGTTFSFSNHLANVCGTINSHVFETSQNFAGTSGVVSNFYSSIPSNWTGSSGNPGVVTAIKNTANSVGYVEYANANTSGLQFAKVNGVSPASFGAAISLPGSALAYNEVISSTNNTNGTAAVSAISGAPSTQCIALVLPADYAVPGARGSILPAGSYPIVGISYLLGNAQGNPAGDLAATQALVNAPYNATIQAGVNTIGTGTGLAFLTPGSTAFSATAPGACLH